MLVSLEWQLNVAHVYCVSGPRTLCAVQQEVCRRLSEWGETQLIHTKDRDLLFTSSTQYPDPNACKSIHWSDARQHATLKERERENNQRHLSSGSQPKYHKLKIILHESNSFCGYLCKQTQVHFASFRKKLKVPFVRAELIIVMLRKWLPGRCYVVARVHHDSNPLDMLDLMIWASCL